MVRVICQINYGIEGILSSVIILDTLDILMVADVWTVYKSNTCTDNILKQMIM